MFNRQSFGRHASHLDSVADAAGNVPESGDQFTTFQWPPGHAATKDWLAFIERAERATEQAVQALRDETIGWSMGPRLVILDFAADCAKGRHENCRGSWQMTVRPATSEHAEWSQADARCVCPCHRR